MTKSGTSDLPFTNRKLEEKFFRPFQVLHYVGKQVYKLELSKKWKIHDVFYMSLLEQDTTRMRQEFSIPEFKSSDDKEYKVEAIYDSAVYAKKADRHLPGLYYLITWKGYSEEENTYEPFLAVIHLRKMITIFYKDHLKKPTTTSAPLHSALPMDKSTIQLSTKRKQGQPTGLAKKHTK